MQTIQRQGGKLGLLGLEAQFFLWGLGGRRIVGENEFQCGFMASARESWEPITSVYPHDLEANLTLGTVYQRLEDLTEADRSLQTSSIIPSQVPVSAPKPWRQAQRLMR